MPSKSETSLLAKIGLPVPPMIYVQHAVQLVHPDLQRVILSSGTVKALSFCAPGLGLELRKVRIQWTKQVTALVGQVRDAEIQLVESRPGHLRVVLKDKRFGLMHRVLEQIGYKDAGVALEASGGFPLVGWMKESGVFAPHVRPPELHVSSLETMAASFSARTLASIKASQDAELDEQVWRATLEEVDGGTLDGPYDVNSLPLGHIVSPRFGIRQGPKIRPIDNLSSSGLNSTVGLPERLQVDSIDEVAAMVKRCMQDSGTSCSLVGRTYDLKRAYRQLGVREDHYRFAWIAVWSTEHKQTKLFRMRGLPFGGTASVAAFLRMSRALKEIGILGPALAWSSFFDDFICLSGPSDIDSADMAVRFLFRAFGWTLSEEPSKDQGFRSVFGALGVEVDLRDVGSGVLRIGNTPKRKAELKSTISQILESNCLTPEQSESLRSRLMFAESQVFGRSAKLALRAVGSPALLGRASEPLSEEVRFGLSWMLDRLVNAAPREVRARASETFHLFIDGACEPADGESSELVTSIGGVLLDERGKGLRFFGMRLPREVTSAWAAGVKQNLVFEAEILPYNLALHCWGDMLRHRHVLVYIDNDGARHSWIRGSADAPYARAMIHQGTLKESELDTTPYFCRVPTSSNLGDGPSRMDFSMCYKLGAVRSDISHELLCKCALPCRDGGE